MRAAALLLFILGAGFLLSSAAHATAARSITIQITNIASGGTVVRSNGSIPVNVSVTGATEAWVFVYDSNGFLQNWGSTNCVNGVGQILIPLPVDDGYTIEAQIWKFGECYDVDIKTNVAVIVP